MTTIRKSALVAALILGSASTAFAANVTANADRAVSSYEQAVPNAYARAPLNDGRAFALQYEYTGGAQGQYPLPAEQQHWYERAPIDFNS
jgi:hypothetical protein